MDIQQYNQDAWNRRASAGNRWTIPVGTDVTEAAR